MDVKVSKGEGLTPVQRAAVGQAYGYAIQMAQGPGGSAKTKTKPKSGKSDNEILPKSEVPRLLRACGRAPTDEEMETLLRKVPDKGLDQDGFVKLFEQACATPSQTEGQLCDLLRTLDLTATDTLKPDVVCELMAGHGSKMAYEDVAKVLEGLPTDSLGRIPCRLIARRLVKGPEGILQY
eukprot:TRINITY_DN13760_c1_g6_i1.p1 TRINITY_DN13760_c1_g6~~TRINITY_DN13760_c1_g6_i1.p1  ORF type:complete len:209 (+),score=51.24 TRINITY_DN13760_c1_g6_i1:88-627(+)